MIAARISHSSLPSEALKALALPRNTVVMVEGRSSAFSSFWIALTASPRATPGAVSKEMLAAGNWPT